MADRDVVRFLVVCPPPKTLGGNDFPGHRTFLALSTSIGISAADTLFISYDDSRFEERIHNTIASVAICIGDRALTRLTGISKSFLEIRGYLFQPQDCLPIRQTVTEQIGLYKTAKKGHHSKGDPRFGKVTRFIRPTLPHQLRWIIATYDPFLLLKERREPLPVIKADLMRALRASHGSFQLLVPPIMSTPPLASEAGSLTLDIETFGFTGGVERIGLATQNHTWSSHWTGASRQATQEAIDSARVLIGHNLAFDIPRLEADGIQFPPAQKRWDTMIASTLLHPRLPKALEKIASIYLDIAPWKHLSVQDPSFYNACDAFYTHRLAVAQQDELENTGMHKLFTLTVMPATRVLMKMTHLGLRIDRDRLTTWRQQLSDALLAHTQTWYEHTQDINPLSPTQLAHHFYTDLRLKPQYTKRGKGRNETLSTDEDSLTVLIALYPQHSEILSTLLSIKRLSKKLNTYASLDLDGDNCIHPSYLPPSKYAENGSAATGRLASTGPNVQNQTPEAKMMFVPHYPGWQFLEFDFSQIELRIAAALASDTTLQEALEADVHARTMDLLGCDRVRAKNVLYGSLYGAGPQKLSRLLRTKGIIASVAECQSLQDTLARAYPRLWAWRAAVAAEGLANGFLTNPFSRRRYFFAASDSIPEMYDYLPQSTAADILWSLLVPLDEFAVAHGGHFLTTTHDSGLFEFPAESLTPQLHQNLRDVCEREWPQVAPGFKVPIVLKTGPNWGTLSPI